MNLTTDTELAERFGMSLKDFHEKRRRKGWPCVRLGRFNVKFTDEQIAQIIAMQSEAKRGSGPTAISVPGQTARSKARRRTG